jgi:hypothetical protein
LAFRLAHGGVDPYAKGGSEVCAIEAKKKLKDYFSSLQRRLAQHNLYEGQRMIRYSRAFFELQWRFAARIAAMSGMPLEQALLCFTNLYIRFGLGRAFDASHPVWRSYIDGLSDATDPVDWTWRFFLTRPQVSPPGQIAAFGCFSYSCSSAQGDAIRLHFANAGPRDVSPLSAACIRARRAELRALFEHVRQTRPATRQVLGTSWLYHLPAYRRLFPAGYVETARESPPRFQNMPLWGQFLDRHGAVRPAVAALFLDRVASRTDTHDLAACFPLRALAVDAPLALFDGFYRSR